MKNLSFWYNFSCFSHRKKSKALKELAEKTCEKRVREYMKRQQQQSPDYGDHSPPSKSGNMLSTLKQKIWSSQGNLSKPPRDHHPPPPPAPTKFSDLVGSGSSSSGGSTIASRAGTVQKRPSQTQKQHSSSCPHSKMSGDGDFKVRELEPDGKRTITSLTGLQRDSEVMYVGTFSSNEGSVGKRGKISDVFECLEGDEPEHSDSRSGYSSTLARSFSQPDILGDGPLGQELSEEMTLQRPVGLFDRPTMLGSIAFRRSVTAALSQLQLHTDTSSTSTMRNAGSNPPKQRNGGSKGRLYLNLSDDTDSEGGGHDIYSDEDEDDRESGGSALQRFLAVWALEEYLPV